MVADSEVLKITTNQQSFFYEYLLLKKPILEMILSRINGKKVKLSPKILKVFSYLLYYNFTYQSLDDKEKWNKVFSDESKSVIMESIGINQYHLNTYLSILRNIKILTGKSISKPFLIYPGKVFNLIFEFNFNGNEK